ncbi:MAG: IclR family transcriptional regulator C-terminal domain-containing protein [Gammaproteobacteria bacterium]
MLELSKPAAKRRGRTPGAKNKAAIGQSQSLIRGMTLLERLAEAERGINLSDLAQQVGLAPSTTHRLLNTLEQKRFVHHDEDLGRWFIGVKAFSVGNAFLHHRDFVAAARPWMHRLMEQAGETVNLGILDDGEAVFLAQVECREMMRMIVQMGSRAPLHASGVGKALLAAMSETQVTHILHRRGLARFTANTLDTPAKLRAALADVRRLGYAYDDEEHAVGLRCVAATLYDEHGAPLAAISVSGPKARILDERIPELGAMVARSAAAITASLGGHQPT